MPARPSRTNAALSALTVLLGTVAAGVPASADGSGDTGGGRPPRSTDGSIGIQLLEATAGRADDPRAHVYVIDHLNPGARMTRRFAVTNTSRSPQQIALSVGPAEIRGNEFVPAADPDANELPEWVTVNRASVLVPPQSSIELRAAVAIPPRASRGERYGAIWAAVASRHKGEPAGTVEKIHRVGIRLYLDIGPGGDPPSDFEISQLVPGRTEEGDPVVRATVRNTGERALDMGGKLWLSDGPGGLSAGPFPVQVGTTVAIGGTADVRVPLDRQLPNGPWQARVRLESGRIHREVTGTLTFPEARGTWGPPALLDGRTRWVLIAGGVALLVVAVLLVVLARRSRTHDRRPPRRQREPVHR
ncbi:hypothetical protein [Micromonospora cathayae]|uniref:DUF916 domain-containing protein n=1 Tax=Micromonospora cathayae TaxID=3028804 RepID=A0ABY7ZIC6_9ACTN|nr:hypothetical protein [Micromonospora sp. HUAS 3]WDZ82263.1 hypothetical protein PVK37_17330 [Micromonospora sp. HUAS 3]